ncbi:MAG: hypothetical protein K0U12_07425 [Gammaproteobacteria bacterium]|nr:hypothetical protein [Gammaproteobacteria bacterium]
MSRQNQSHDIPSGFNTTGCWVRGISVERELKILAYRKDKLWHQLLGHNNQSDLDYTDYSACTFVKNHLPILLFSSVGKKDEIGVFIRPFNRKIDWFFTGGGKHTVTDSIKKIPGQPFNNGNKKDCQRWNTSTHDILSALTALYNRYQSDDYYQENPDVKVCLPWNEGFLRYQTQDITGILINPKSPSSITKALAFRKALDLGNPNNPKEYASLFSYDPECGTTQRHSSHTLCRQFKITDIAIENLRKKYTAKFEQHSEAVEKLRASDTGSTVAQIGTAPPFTMPSYRP